MKVIKPITITPAMVTSSTAAEPGTGENAYNALTDYSVGDEVIRTETHRVYVSLRGEKAVVTISNGTPAVVGWADHGQEAGQGLSFTTTGGLPSGLTTGQVYYVVNPTISTFQVAATPGGAAIDTSSGGTGVHTAVISTNLGNTPETSPIYWKDKGPTNKYAPFDTSISTKAALASPLGYEIAPDSVIDSFAAIGMVGATSVHATMIAGATTLYDQTFPLDGTVIDDWYDWLYALDTAKRSLVAFDLPPHSGATTAIDLIGGGDVAVGALILGSQYDIGTLQAGARRGMIDYSRKEFDEFGQEILVERRFSRTISGTLLVANAEVERVIRVLESLRATPAVYVGVIDHDDLTEPLTVYGFIREVEEEFAYPTYSIISFRIEGLSES